MNVFAAAALVSATTIGSGAEVVFPVGVAITKLGSDDEVVERASVAAEGRKVVDTAVLAADTAVMLETRSESMPIGRML